ncbi:MAG: recombinase family protein [Eubacterium sp.]|nr:recombinase family protein [Eubacterium sp.]
MNQTESMKTAFGYIRVSTHMQEEISPEAQKHELQKWAKQHNILITEWFQDNGISGKRAENRSDFQRMIALAKESDHPDYILAWKFSRFARNQEESIVYKSLLRKNNVQVVSISEPLPDGPFSSLIERIIEWMDEYYSIRLSGEVMRGMKEKAKQGGYQSAPPLGYRREKGNPVPVIYEPEAEIYRAIKEYCLNGYNPTTIARLINDAGYHTRRGNRFETRNIIYILKNPFYIGKVRWNRVKHCEYYENSPEEIIVADGQHAPLCSMKEWEIISKKMEKHTPGSSGRKRSKSLLSHYLSGGLFRCRTCGASMSYAKGTQRNSNRAYPYFCCWKYSKGLHNGGGHIIARRCEDALLNSLQEFVERGQSDITYTVEHTPDTAASDASRYEQQLKKLAIRETRAKEAYLDGIDTKEEYRENRKLIQNEIALVQDKIRSLSQPADVIETEEIHVNIAEIILKLQDETISTLEKHTALASVLERMEYDKEKDEFFFYYLFDEQN